MKLVSSEVFYIGKLNNFMENKNVGYLVLGLSAVVLVIIFIFNSALKEIVNQGCGMEGHLNCPMYDTITKQTYLALSIWAIVVILGIFMIYTKQSEKIVVKKVESKKAKAVYDLSELTDEEKKVFSLIQENRAIFQADLIEKTGVGKVKMTRIIDRLEGKGFVERKRRGMTNVVVLKE